MPIKRIEPRYPEKARLLRISGIVILECTIDKSGVVRDGRVLKGLPVPTMAYAALEAVRHWTFQPATVDGEPVNVFFNLTINFRLVAEEDKPQPSPRVPLSIGPRRPIPFPAAGSTR